MPFSFAFELTGAALLCIRFIPEFGWGRGIYFALFHAISAFCNAGFDLMGARAPFSSLTAYAGDPLVTLTISALIVIGGLGFVVWRDLVHCRFRFSKLQLHTRLVLTVTGILLGGGWLLFLLFERNAALAGLRPGEKALSALFLAVTPRTAGFNTVDMAQLSESGNLLTNVLMLIGGSPGSTAGGIKTTTVAVLLLSTFASGRGSTRVHAFRYSIDRDTIRQANSILLTYLSMSTAAILAICCLDPRPAQGGDVRGQLGHCDGRPVARCDAGALRAEPHHLNLADVRRAYRRTDLRAAVCAAAQRPPARSPER